jgi:hypothetical protein
VHEHLAAGILAMEATCLEMALSFQIWASGESSSRPKFEASPGLSAPVLIRTCYLGGYNQEARLSSSVE